MPPPFVFGKHTQKRMSYINGEEIPLSFVALIIDDEPICLLASRDIADHLSILSKLYEKIIEAEAPSSVIAIEYALENERNRRIIVRHARHDEQFRLISGIDEETQMLIAVHRRERLKRDNVQVTTDSNFDFDDDDLREAIRQARLAAREEAGYAELVLPSADEIHAARVRRELRKSPVIIVDDSVEDDEEEGDEEDEEDEEDDEEVA